MQIRLNINKKMMVCPDCLFIPVPLLRPLQWVGGEYPLQCPHCGVNYKEKENVGEGNNATVSKD